MSEQDDNLLPADALGDPPADAAPAEPAGAPAPAPEDSVGEPGGPMPPEGVVDVEGGDVHQPTPLAGEPTSQEQKGLDSAPLTAESTERILEGDSMPPEGTTEIPFADDPPAGEDVVVHFEDTPSAEDPGE